jgi:copper chaperone CopZ
MESKTFTVPNISCGHCVHTIQSEVSDLAGVKSVQADQASKQVTIQWESPATWQQIEALLREINYAPATSSNVELR